MVRRSLALALLLTFILSGCWSRRDLTEISFAGIMGLDWVDGQYQVVLNIITPPGGAESGGPKPEGTKVWTVSAAGNTIDDAVSRIDRMVSRSLTLAHVRSIMIGESLARRGIGPAMDFLLRSVEVRPTAWVGVTHGPVMQVMLLRPSQELFPAEGPLGHHDMAAERSPASPVHRLAEVARILIEEGIDLTLPLFRSGDDEGPVAMDDVPPDPGNANEVLFGGAGVFRGDKLVGWLSPRGASGLRFALGQVTQGAVTAPCPGGGHLTLRVRGSRGAHVLSWTNGAYRGSVNVQVIGDLNDLQCQNGPAGAAVVDLAEQQLATEVREQVREALNVTRETGSDFFGFGQYLFRRAPIQFRRRAPHWRDHLKKMPIAVHVQAQVPRLGQLQPKYRWQPDGE